MTVSLAALVAAAACLLACTSSSLASPILGVPAYSLHNDAVLASSSGVGVVNDAAATEGVEFAHLVVTTANPSSATATPAEDVVPLDSSKDRGRFLVTLLMLESLHDKPFPARGASDPKLRQQLLADEDVMQEVLKLYESQQTKGQHFIKIPPKLLKKMKRKMKELLSD